MLWRRPTTGCIGLANGSREVLKFVGCAERAALVIVWAQLGIQEGWVNTMALFIKPVSAEEVAQGSRSMIVFRRVVPAGWFT